MTFTRLYWAFFIFSLLDILITRLVLKGGGAELNPIANYVLQTWGFYTVVGFKCILLCIPLTIAEVLRRMGKSRPAKVILFVAVASAMLPALFTLVQMIIYHS